MDGLLVFFNDTAATEIYTLSRHDALPIWVVDRGYAGCWIQPSEDSILPRRSMSPVSKTFQRVEKVDLALCSGSPVDRKSTRLNSSHANISYAVFCLKKKTLTSPLHVFMNS